MRDSLQITRVTEEKKSRKKKRERETLAEAKKWHSQEVGNWRWQEIANGAFLAGYYVSKRDTPPFLWHAIDKPVLLARMVRFDRSPPVRLFNFSPPKISPGFVRPLILAISQIKLRYDLCDLTFRTHRSPVSCNRFFPKLRRSIKKNCSFYAFRESYNSNMIKNNKTNKNKGKYVD